MSINSGDRPWPQTLDHEDMEWPPEEQRVLVPFREAVNVTETGFLGASVTFGTDGSLYILHAVEDDVSRPAEIREHVELKREIQDEFGVPVVQQTDDYSRSMLDSFVSSHSITTTVVDREEASLFPTGRPEETVLRDCHTVVGTGMDAFDSPSSILVPVAKGPHSGLATRIAESIARAYGAWIELFHVLPEDAPEETERDADKLLDAYSYQLDDDVEVDYHVLRAPDTAEAIVEHAGYHSLTILGAPEKGKLRRFLFGSTTDEVTRNAESKPILTAHRASVDSFVSRWF
ncbi:universal stress protein [Halosimplex amylolyticum]|uniref:universal stress protein n=1 Tax=Halosimplex amylolyticum TaxID=3396616 RepID=UPI003F56176B